MISLPRCLMPKWWCPNVFITGRTEPLDHRDHPHSQVGQTRKSRMDPKPDELFRPMETLFEDWLRGARLSEIVHPVHLVRAELTRRGIDFSWSSDQAGPSALS